ncbi:hypothetical protein C0992_002119, partial [Termitomyces sp. T32_za158]
MNRHSFVNLGLMKLDNTTWILVVNRWIPLNPSRSMKKSKNNVIERVYTYFALKTTVVFLCAGAARILKFKDRVTTYTPATIPVPSCSITRLSLARGEGYVNRIVYLFLAPVVRIAYFHDVPPGYRGLFGGLYPSPDIILVILKRGGGIVHQNLSARREQGCRLMR